MGCICYILLGVLFLYFLLLILMIVLVIKWKFKLDWTYVKGFCETLLVSFLQICIFSLFYSINSLNFNRDSTNNFLINYMHYYP